MAQYAFTFTSGDTVTPTKLNDARTVSEIVDADIKSDAAIAGTKLADDSVVLQKLATAVRESLLPAGAVQAFAMNSAPAGWLEADGTAVSRTDYAALFSALGTTYGAGDGSTTFALPDLRGIFVRGSGSQTISGTTYNKTFAAKERDAVGEHKHPVRFGTGNTGSTTRLQANSISVGSSTIASQADDPDAGLFATETRPANIALLYCIKF
jgi:microcystin-dependent protein